MESDESESKSVRIGPVLSLRGVQDGRLSLAALVVRPAGDPAPALETDEGAVPAAIMDERCGMAVHRYLFTLPAIAGASYRFDGTRIEVAGAVDGDLRVAYVSCNGMEHGDLDRPERERNGMWRRLVAEHAEAPFNLLLNGGDQVYADEMTGADPASDGWPMRNSYHIEPDCVPRLHGALCDAWFRRYVHVFQQPEFAWLAARVPMLSMWDDHDIADGWGSYPEEMLDSEVGRAIFAAAREWFLLFQLGAAPGEVPPFCPDRTGTSLTWSVRLPGLAVIAPDLRSERRQHRVMGEKGWEAFRAALAASREPRVLILSSVPAIGPRLSLIERWFKITPWWEEYEDDFNDQWQSTYHREEWCEFLRAAIAEHEREGTRVTFLSGEIHLATRGTIGTATEDLHQLVASGIAHPPPTGMEARILGVLANLPDSPLPENPMRLRPLPGRKKIYTPERNYLVLTRAGDRWAAEWELEESGRTPALAI